MKESEQRESGRSQALTSGDLNLKVEMISADLRHHHPPIPAQARRAAAFGSTSVSQKHARIVHRSLGIGVVLVIKTL